MRIFYSFLNRVRKTLLNPVSRSVMKEKLTYLSVKKLSRIERAVRETKKLDGDILEFGVALGGSGIILARAASNGRRFLGFDVFSMIPPPISDKDDEKSKQRYEVIKAGKSTGIGGDEYYGYKNDLLGEVEKAFARHDVPVDGDTVILLKGLFEETWPTAGVSSIALAHIDCDWYDPVKYCLNICAEKLQRGGIIVIDDYNDYGGCRTAVDEFLTQRGDFIFEGGANPFLHKQSG